MRDDDFHGQLPRMLRLGVSHAPFLSFGPPFAKCRKYHLPLLLHRIIRGSDQVADVGTLSKAWLSQRDSIPREASGDTGSIPALP